MKSQPSDASPELTQASQWTRNYRNQNPGAPKGHRINKSQLDAILSQPGCEGIRVYYGLDEDNNRKLVMVGIDADENDIISTSTTAALRTASSDTESADTASVSVATDFPTCPPTCCPENTLNS